VTELERIDKTSAVSTLRFSLMAGLGAMALGVIFGALHLLSLALIGLSGFLGGQLRRAIARVSDNTLIQPFAAALLAGAIGAVTVRLDFTTLQRLVAVCPCMVLVLGPHLLNGAIDAGCWRHRPREPDVEPRPGDLVDRLLLSRAGD